MAFDSILVWLAMLMLMLMLETIIGGSSRNKTECFFPFITDPQLKEGDRFYLRTVNGKYVSVCFACKGLGQNLVNQCAANLCLKDEPVATSIFTYLPHRDGTFSVRTYDGRYWKRCENCFNRCPNIICADGINQNLAPAKFVLIKNGDSAHTVSIKTDIERLFETQNCEQSCGEIIAAMGVGTNKQFRIEKLPETVKAWNQHTPHKRFRMPSYAPIIIPFQD
jgi:hypothetical protein